MSTPPLAERAPTHEALGRLCDLGVLERRGYGTARTRVVFCVSKAILESMDVCPTCGAALGSGDSKPGDLGSRECGR